MRQSGIRAAKTKVRGNFTQGRRQSLGIVLSLNESEYLLLPFRQCLHTEQMSSIRKILSRGEQRKCRDGCCAPTSICANFIRPSLFLCPGRTFENSPAIYRWVDVPLGLLSPGGRKKFAQVSILSCLTGLIKSRRPTPPINRTIFCRPVGCFAYGRCPSQLRLL